MGAQQERARDAGPCWSPHAPACGTGARAGSVLLSTFISTAPENWGLLFHGPRPCRQALSEVSRGAPVPWRHNGINLQKPQPKLCASCHHTACHRLGFIPPAGHGAVEGQPGHGMVLQYQPGGARSGTWGQGAMECQLHEHSHRQPGRPCRICQPEGFLWDPGWPCGGSVAGAYMEMVLERERKLSTQSQKYGPCPSRESISSSHQRVMACHAISSSHLATHLIIFLFTWNKGFDVPQCLPGDSTVPPAEGLDPVAVSTALHMAELGPAHDFCLWFCSFLAALWTPCAQT